MATLVTEAPSHCAVTVTVTVVRAHIRGGGGGGGGAGCSCPWGSSHAAGPWCTDGGQKNSGDTISCFIMSSLRRGHADHLCNIPSFTCDTLLRGCAIMGIWWAYVKPVGLVYFGRTVRRHTQVLAAGRRHPGLPWCTYGMYPPDTPIMRVP